MVVVQSVTFVIYTWRTVDDLALSYLGWFGLALPTVAIWLGISAISVELHSRPAPSWRVASTAFSIVVIFALSCLNLARTQLINGDRGDPTVAKMVQVIGREPGALHFEQDQWPIAVGVLAESRRSGGHLCVADPKWAFMVTQELICDSKDHVRRITITTEGSPVDTEGRYQELLRSDGLVLLVAP